MAYYSKKLLPREESYSVIEKKCLAIKSGIAAFKLSKPVEIHDLAEPIPEDVEEQEKMLTKIYETVGYSPTHYTPRRSMVQMAGSRLFQGTPSRSWSLAAFQLYLLGRPFKIQTDHCALVWLNQLKDMNSRLTQYSLSLQPFKFEVAQQCRCPFPCCIKP